MKNEIVNKIIELRLLKTPHQQISETVGVSVRTVQRVLHQNKMPFAAARAKNIEFNLKRCGIDDETQNYTRIKALKKIEAVFFQRNLSDVPDDKLFKMLLLARA